MISDLSSPFRSVAADLMLSKAEQSGIGIAKAGFSVNTDSPETPGYTPSAVERRVTSRSRLPSPSRSPLYSTTTSALSRIRPASSVPARIRSGISNCRFARRAMGAAPPRLRKSGTLSMTSPRAMTRTASWTFGLLV